MQADVPAKDFPQNGLQCTEHSPQRLGSHDGARQHDEKGSYPSSEERGGGGGGGKASAISSKRCHRVSIWMPVFHSLASTETWQVLP